MNPKDVQGLTRAPLWLFPRVAVAWGAAAFQEGLQRNPNRWAYNWRDQPIKLSGYLSALERHYSAIVDGQWCDQHADEDGKMVEGLPHLASVLTNAAIILDADACGSLIRDLPKKAGGVPALLRKLEADYLQRPLK
jgi:hypothetical protein